MGYETMYSPFEGSKAYGLRALLPRRTSRARKSVVMTLLLLIFVWLFIRVRDIHAARAVNGRLNSSFPCDFPQKGFQCHPEVSHIWGQYSPAFSVPSEISWDTPEGCRITFAQLLSRHGARYPTAKMSSFYEETIAFIQSAAKNLTGAFAFLRNYKYDLESDQLTDFGRQEMLNAGIAFYQRYQTLAAQQEPFVRASGQDRVVESADNFLYGFYAGKRAASDSVATSKRLASGIEYSAWYDAVHKVLIIPEHPESNNTLSHGLCPDFEAHHYQSSLKSLEPIALRINALLPGANLSLAQVSALMDLCPFDTVSSSDLSTLSSFCYLFTETEWMIYDTEKTLGKYSSYGGGSTLGPSQGVGWVNELIARLTSQAVEDHTSVNGTLDSNPATFPLGRMLYADFSHDNVMTSIFFALGLYNGSASATSEDLAGFKASETVPFAGRAVIEKMACDGETEELVRVIINGRVMPLLQCHGDDMGRCTVSRFIESLDFARKGGRWKRCFDL